MPHADSAYVPDDIVTKDQFYEHVVEQLVALLDGSRYWVSNLAQTSSLLSNSFLSSPLFGYATPADANGSSTSPKVNWVGFYLLPPHHQPSTLPGAPLLLGPYVGRPACIIIQTKSGSGVCADAYVGDKTVVVEDVEAYPGHIACDGETRSEIVVPLRTPQGTIGVLDLDSVAHGTFDEADQRGLERIAEILTTACDWE